MREKERKKKEEKRERGGREVRKREREKGKKEEREKNLLDFMYCANNFFLLSTFDRLPCYEDGIPKDPSVYDDLIAAEGSSRTMIRVSSFIPRSHPRTCRISEPTTRREFDSHIEHIARFRVARIIRISIRLSDVCNMLVNIEQTA